MVCLCPLTFICLLMNFQYWLPCKKSLVVILSMRIATIFIVIINIVKIMIFTNYLEYIGGSSVLPSYGRVNVSRQTSPVCRDPVGNIKSLNLRHCSKFHSQKVFQFLSSPIESLWSTCYFLLSPFWIAGHHSCIIQLPILSGSE